MMKHDRPARDRREPAQRTCMLAASVLSATVTVALIPTALAQSTPDAGKVTRELEQKTLELPRESKPALQIAPSPQAAPSSTNDGARSAPRITLTAVRVTGSTVFASHELEALLAPWLNRPVGVDELQEAADRITRHYRAQGYPVARAYLPPQDVRDGEVRIAVLEGELGAFQIENTSRVRSDVLAAYLQPLRGRLIESRVIERQLLLVYGLAGAAPSGARLAPGATVGQADLALDLAARPALGSSLQLDNYGDRYTGERRLMAGAEWASPTGRGDRLAARLTYGDPDLAYGDLRYTRPLGVRGLEVQTDFARTRYTLGEEFAALDARGQADTWSVDLSYPLVLSPDVSMRARLGQMWRDLEDRIEATATRTDKRSRITTVAVSGDVRDGLGRGGVTAFEVEYARGKLTLDSLEARNIDDATARSAGDFGAWRLALQRLQPLSERFSLYVAGRAQWADKNLDSSEKFVLAGAQGVRAYAPGEASGDEGYLGTLELRYALQHIALGALTPFTFAETGEVTINEQPFATGRNHRRLSAAGLGLRWRTPGELFVQASIAHRLGNEPASVVAEDDEVRTWVQIARQF